MSETVPVKRRGMGLQTWAVLLSSLVIAFPILVSKLVEAILFSANPAGVDVNNELAYLRELLGFGFGAVGVLLVVLIVVYVVIYRREGTLDALRLPLLILAIQVVVGVLILLFTAIANGTQGA